MFPSRAVIAQTTLWLIFFFFNNAHNSALSGEGIAYFSVVIKCKKACCCNVVDPILCTAMNICIYDSYFALVYLGNGEMFMCTYTRICEFSIFC